MSPSVRPGCPSGVIVLLHNEFVGPLRCVLLPLAHSACKVLCAFAAAALNVPLPCMLPLRAAAPCAHLARSACKVLCAFVAAAALNVPLPCMLTGRIIYMARRIYYNVYGYDVPLHALEPTRTLRTLIL